MSNVPGLTTYMLSGQWEQELNKENPLGMRGEIAISFAELIREMWSGMRAYTVPRNFKVSVTFPYAVCHLETLLCFNLLDFITSSFLGCGMLIFRGWMAVSTYDGMHRCYC